MAEEKSKADNHFALTHYAVQFSPDLNIESIEAQEWLIRFKCGCYRRVGPNEQVYGANLCSAHDERALRRALSGDGRG